VWRRVFNKKRRRSTVGSARDALAVYDSRSRSSASLILTAHALPEAYHSAPHTALGPCAAAGEDAGDDTREDARRVPQAPAAGAADAAAAARLHGRNRR